MLTDSYNIFNEDEIHEDHGNQYEKKRWGKTDFLQVIHKNIFFPNRFKMNDKFRCWERGSRGSTSTGEGLITRHTSCSIAIAVITSRKVMWKVMSLKARDLSL